MDAMFKSLAALAMAVSFAAFSIAKADTNVALSPTDGGTNAGVALFGWNYPTSISTLGTLGDHAGSSTNLNDGNTNGSTGGDDSWGTGGNFEDGFVGAEFTLSPSTAVTSVVLYGRDFVDGGWFGNAGIGPDGISGDQGGTLTAGALVVPTLQYTTDGGVTWITDSAVSNNYVTQMTGAVANSGAPTNPSTFTLTTPLSGIDGIRLIGPSGGTSSFIGADEIEVFAGAVPEPSTWALMLGGAGLLAWLVRRRAVRV